MGESEQVSIATIAQHAIEDLVGKISEAGISMRLLGNAEGYLRAAESLDCWVDPACAQQRGGASAGMFWIEFSDVMRTPIALGAALNWQTDDLMTDIANGSMWYSGGFAEHCALQHIELAEPSRLISGSLSYMQLSVSRVAAPQQQIVEQMALLLQGLAFRHHKSTTVVQLGVHARQLNGTPRLTECFIGDDFLTSTYFPPAETIATLNLLYNSGPDYLRLVGLADPSPKTEATAIPVSA